METKKEKTFIKELTFRTYFYPNFWHINNNSTDNDSQTQELEDNSILDKNNNNNSKNAINKKQRNSAMKDYELQYIEIQNKLCNTTISNHSGGSIKNSILNEVEHNGQYKYLQKDLPQAIDLNTENEYLGKHAPVVLNGGTCNPCLGYYDANLKEYQYFDSPFKILTPNIKNNYFIQENDSLTIDFQYEWNEMIINKSVTFYGDSYKTNHTYSVENAFNNKLEII